MGTGEAKILDYDLTGKPGDRYSKDYSSSLKDTKRHQKAVAGRPMAALHDCFSLASLARQYASVDQECAESWTDACAAIHA